MQLKRFAISIAALAALGLSVGAYAQTTTSFYVVQDVKTKKCTIVDKKPTSSTTVVAGDTVYHSRTEAEGAIKTTKVCTE